MRTLIFLSLFSLNLLAEAESATKLEGKNPSEAQEEASGGIADYLYSWYTAGAAGMGYVAAKIPIPGLYCGCGGCGQCPAALSARRTGQTLLAFVAATVTTWLAARGYYKMNKE